MEYYIVDSENEETQSNLVPKLYQSVDNLWFITFTLKCEKYGYEYHEQFLHTREMIRCIMEKFDLPYTAVSEITQSSNVHWHVAISCSRTYDIMNKMLISFRNQINKLFKDFAHESKDSTNSNWLGKFDLRAFDDNREQLKSYFHKQNDLVRIVLKQAIGKNINPVLADGLEIFLE